jgi:hypothetical protein
VKKSALVAFLVCMVAASFGAKELYRWSQDRNLVEISCANYLAHPPSSRYVRLTNCNADTHNSLVRMDDGRLDAEFVPLRPSGTSGPAPLVLETDDGRFLAGNAYEGMMRIGFLDEPSDGFMEQLARDTNTSPDAVILAIGKTPGFGLGIIVLTIGLCGMTIAGFRLR